PPTLTASTTKPACQSGLTSRPFCHYTGQQFLIAHPSHDRLYDQPFPSPPPCHRRPADYRQ
ncbi:MAG: hypothetical protein ACK5GA_04305, partial [Holosporaceae bacterium]